MANEQFIVKHYSAEERPILKGNGFDGLEIGQTREEAQDFIDWVNKYIVAPHKDHIIREAVNQLVQVAKDFHNTQQLRAQIQEVVLPLFEQPIQPASDSPNEQELFEKAMKRLAFPFDKSDDGRYIFDSTKDAYLAWLECVAIRPSSVLGAVDELPPLPEPLELVWPDLHSNALGCGIEDRGIKSVYDAAEYGWQDGVDKAIDCLPSELYDAEQMREYARAAIASAPRPTNDELWDQTLAERDRYHDMADNLADAIAEHFDADIGEHSNLNCPWEQALLLIKLIKEA